MSAWHKSDSQPFNRNDKYSFMDCGLVPAPGVYMRRATANGARISGFGRGCIAVVVALATSGCEEKAPPPAKEVIRPVITMVVGNVEKFQSNTFPGSAKATREVNIGFEVSGKMIERRVDVGDVVKRGQLLAVLEPDRYLADVERLEAEKASLAAVLTNATTNLERQEKLLKKGHVSQARVDNAVMAVRASEAKIKAVEAAIKRANVVLSDTGLNAPFSGTVSELFAENFQNVVAKQPIIRLLDTSRIEMEVAVPGDLIGLAPYVTKITVTFKDLGGVEVPATIKEIGNEASQTTRTYPVTIVMDHPKGARIRPGMAGQVTAIAELPDEWTKNGIEGPSAAVFSPGKARAEQAFVWIVDDASKTVALRSIELKGLGERGLLIDGVNPGERLVIAGVSALTEGQKVRLLDQ